MNNVDETTNTTTELASETTETAAPAAEPAAVDHSAAATAEVEPGEPRTEADDTATTPAVDTAAAEDTATDDSATTSASASQAEPTATAPKPQRGPKGGAPGKPGGAAGKPGGSPKPGKPRPSKPKRPTVHLPAMPVQSTEELAERGRQWGHANAECQVFVTVAGEDISIGSYADTTEDEALAFFVRKYDEIAAQVTLAEQRLALPEPPFKDVKKSLAAVQPELDDPKVLGDIAGLRQRVAAMEESIVGLRKEAEERRAAAKAQAHQERLDMVKQAEELANKDPERVQWKQAGDAMKALFDQWREHQKNAARLDKPVEEELWSKFKAARNTFDRNRRTHFAQLDRQHESAKTIKEGLVKQAEALATSTDWGPTAGEYRNLMTKWKAAGRAGRKDDDALWERFRGAQDRFFAARDEANAQIDAEFGENLKVKEKLLVEAEALLPIKDVKAAKQAMRSIADRWEAAGKVPRGDVQRVEGRLRAVEQAIRDIEQDKWKRTNPEAKARAEGALGQLHDSIASLEADLAKAQQAGNARKVKDIESALATRRAWLEQLEKTAADFSA